MLRRATKARVPPMTVTRAELLRVAEFLRAVEKGPWPPSVGPGVPPPAVVDVRIVEYGDCCILVGLPPTAHRGYTLEFFNETQWPVNVAFVGKGAGELDPNPLEIQVGCDGKLAVSKKDQGKPKTHVIVNCHPIQKAKKAKTAKKAQPPTIVPMGGPDMGIADP